MFRTVVPFRGVGIATVVLVGACTVDRPEPFAPEGGDTDPETLAALSWIGTYDGWGTMEVDGATNDVSDVVMRISLDPDSLRAADCASCLTVTIAPWFSISNTRPPLADQAFLSYREGDVIRSVAMNRFSGGGQVANAMLVKLRYEQPQAGGTLTLLDADLQFRAR